MIEKIEELLERSKNLKNKCSCCEQVGENVYISRYHEIQTQNLAEAVYLIDKLLDFITNLQQEINKLTAESTEWESKYYDLQQENEFLKLNNPEQNIEHFRIVKENKRKIDNLRKENKKLKEKLENKLTPEELVNMLNQELVRQNKCYKSRCEKAIEYIENNKKETSSHFNGKEYVYRNFTLCCEPNDLLNILNGSDEK